MVSLLHHPLRHLLDFISHTGCGCSPSQRLQLTNNSLDSITVLVNMNQLVISWYQVSIEMFSRPRLSMTSRLSSSFDSIANIQLKIFKRAFGNRWQHDQYLSVKPCKWCPDRQLSRSNSKLGTSHYQHLSKQSRTERHTPPSMCSMTRKKGGSGEKLATRWSHEIILTTWFYTGNTQTRMLPWWTGRKHRWLRLSLAF